MRQLSEELLQAIAELEGRTVEQAEINIGAAVLEGMTAPQRRAALAAEQLKILGTELDYAHTRLRAQLLDELDTGELWSFHPSSPAAFKELVVELGVSKSEASDLLAWERHIYPYLKEHFDLGPFEVWQLLGKTKRRRITPYLRHVLDGNHVSNSDKVRQGVAMFRDKARQSVVERASRQWAGDFLAAKASQVAVVKEWAEIGEALLAGQELSPEQGATLLDAYTQEFWPGFDWTRETVSAMLDMAQTSSSGDIERNFSPEPTPGIEALVIRHPVRRVDADGTVTESVRYQLVMTVSEDQLRMVRERMHDRFDMSFVDGALIEELMPPAAEISG